MAITTFVTAPLTPPASAPARARWEEIRNYNEQVPAEVRARVEHFGDRIGAGAYWEVFRVKIRPIEGGKGRWRALAVLKPNAHARRGARILKRFAEMADASDEFKNVTRMVIAQAERMAAIETNSNFAIEQDQIANEKYRRAVTVGDLTVDFKPVELEEAGAGYRVMSLAKGMTFNDLPGRWQRHKKLRRQVAMAHEANVLAAKFAGGKACHDRNGAQFWLEGVAEALKVPAGQPRRLTAHMLDFGAVTLNEPKRDDRRTFADLFWHGAKTILDTHDFDAFSAAVLDFVLAEEQRLGAISDQLIADQRGLLAEADQLRHLNQGDVAAVLEAAMGEGVHEDIQQRLLERMANEPQVAERLGQISADEAESIVMHPIGAAIP